MKILMVTPYYYPTVIGGTESLIENISIKLNELGVLTDVMTFNVDQTWKREVVEIRGLNVIKIPAAETARINGLNVTGILCRIKFIPSRFTREFKGYDVIHFHNDVDLSFPFFSYLVDKPKIFHCHCLDTSYNDYRRYFLSRYIFKKVAHIYIALSKPLLEKLVNLGIPRTRIKVVPNGIDIKRFQPKREIEIENLLLFVGRLDPKKGLPVLFKSLNHVETRVQLVIIGPPSQSPYFERILMLIKKVNEKTIHRVTYMGVLELEELIKWYQKASIFVLSSLSESFPIVNMEALACGTPVVASNVGAIPEIVLDGKNGILVPANDPVKLAQGIQYLLDNEKIRKKFGETGRKWIVEKFSSEAVAERLCQIYNEIIH